VPPTSNKAYFSDITLKNIYQFYPQDGGESQLALRNYVTVTLCIHKIVHGLSAKYPQDPLCPLSPNAGYASAQK